jgi:1,2-phenylacetyl-CoA epoxidase catalytic subunit
MSVAKEITSQAEMTPEYRQTVVQMMESQAYRELAAAVMFGDGLKYVPSLKWLKFMTWHIREEMEHYEAVVKMYQEFTGTSVEPIVNARLAQKPIPFATSWFELAMAQFLYDRGGFWQLQEYDNCSFVGYRTVVEKIIEEERGHQTLGERIVVDLVKSGQFERDKQPIFDRWFRIGMLSFGRPESSGNRYAMSVGLKKRDSGDVMRDFVNDIKPCMRACGLKFQPIEQWSLDVPADLDLAL